MANVPANVAAAARALGGPSVVSLLELLMISGDYLFVADLPLLAPSAIQAAGGGAGTMRHGNIPGLPPAPAGMVAFAPWLMDPPQWSLCGTTTTQTATAVVQNVSGDRVQRDQSLLFNAEELWGAMFVYRLWHAGLETSLLTVVGNVSDAEAEDNDLSLTLRDFGNWSEIKAPDCMIGPICGLTFGSQACGSTSPTPCQYTWGSCSQQNRFKGIVNQWSTDVTQVPATGQGTAQPIPTIEINLRRQG
jgi:hypothetical protein